MSKTAEKLYEILEGLAPLYEICLPDALMLSERRARAANLYDDAPLLVRTIAEVFEDYGDLFPDVRLDPKALKEVQEDADALWVMRAHLVILYRLCMDSYLCRQEEGLKKALRTLKQLRMSAELVKEADPLLYQQRMVAVRKGEIFAPSRSRTKKGPQAKGADGRKGKSKHVKQEG